MSSTVKPDKRALEEAETVISSSLTPQAALLVPISGFTDPAVDCRGFTGSEKDRL